MNPVDEVLRRELTELLSDPTFKARLDRADAELAAARAALLEGYGRWRRALEAVVNLWALAVWLSDGCGPAERKVMTNTTYDHTPPSSP